MSNYYRIENNEYDERDDRGDRGDRGEYDDPGHIIGQSTEQERIECFLNTMFTKPYMGPDPSDYFENDNISGTSVFDSDERTQEKQINDLRTGKINELHERRVAVNTPKFDE